MNSIRRFKSILLAAALLLFASQVQAKYTQMGKIKSMDKKDQNITFTCENGTVRLSFLEKDLVRVHMSPDGVFPEDSLHLDQNGPYFVVKYDWPGVEYEVSEEFDYDLEGEVYTIKAGKVVVKVRKVPFKIAFFDTYGNILTMEKPGIVDAGLGYEGEKVFETMATDEDEHFFGFGAHNHPLDAQGEKILCYARELERQHARGGFPTPFFYSNKGYGIFFNNLDDDVTFEMGTTPEEYSFSGTSGKMEGWDMDYYFIYGPKFDKILNRYTDIVGKPILPEKWFFGHIQHHCCSWKADDVINTGKKYREMDLPCDVLIMDHQALAKDFKWDIEKGYANYKQMYDTITPLGFKTSFSVALFDDVDDWTQFDPTVKADVDRHFAKYVPIIEDGMDFWRQDNSERSMNYTGKTHFANGYKAHQLFGSLWAKGVVEGMEAMGLYGRPVISRGGPIGGHRYIIPWPGDTPFGLQFLNIDLSFMSNGGLVGYSSISFDQGGFTNRGKGEPLEEQNIVRRVIDMKPFVPISKYQGDGDAGAKLPWLTTKQQQNLLRYYLKLRYRTLPYRYSAAIEASLTGRPIVAPMVFDNQDDKKTYDKDFQFLMGRSILVAPVMEDTDKWDVYLPAGKWIDYWTGKEYKGKSTVTVDAPLYGKNSLPMFVKAGAIIPMMPEMSYIYEKSPDPLTLDIYPEPGKSSTYTMYDCDSVKKPVKVNTTEFTCSDSDSKIEISAGDSKAAYELWVHAAKAPTSVTVDGKKLKKLSTKAEYDKAQTGFFYGPGCFYGSDTISTINVKLARNAGSHKIVINK